MASYIKGISIEFSANTEKLNGALKKTQGTLNKTEAELKAVNRSLRFQPRSTVLLSQKFELLQQKVDQTKRKVNDLRKLQNDMRAAGVKETSTQWKQLEREIVKTEDQLKRAEAELRRFGSVGKQQVLAVGQAFQSAGAKIKSAGRTITTTMSVYGVAGVYAGKKLIDMSQQQAQAEQKLVEIYKTRMGANKAAAQSTMELASALQQQGVVGDEVALAFSQQMATYSSMPSTVNALMPAFENLLVQQKGLNGTQEDAVGLANMFGKAMMGQTGALKRAGISFTDAQAEVLKYGTEEEKAAMMAKVITENVGHMNAEFAKTDAGKIQQAKNALGDMGEQIGAVLLPAVADLVSWFQNNLMPKLQQLITFMQQHPAIAKFALAFAGITAVLGPLIMMIGGVISAIGTIISIGPALSAAFTAMTGPIGLVIAAIAAAIAIGIALYKNWDKIKDWAKKTWTAIKTAVMRPVKQIKTQVTATFSAVKAKIISIWTSIRSKVSTVVNGIKTKVSSVFSSLKSTVKRVWDGIKNAITHPIKTAKEKVSEVIEKIKGFFPLKLGKILSFSLPIISISSIAKKIGEKLTHAPKFGVSYQRYAKAVDTPYMFRNATLFGAGETRDEVLYGRSNLMRDIAEASGGGKSVTINNYINGADSPEVWGYRLARQLEMEMRA